MDNLENWQILIVEDEYDSIQMLSKVLKHYGASVAIAHNGYECLDMLEREMPKIILMDLALPQMDGWEALAKIRDNPAMARIPIVAMTSYHSVNLEEDALKAGFNAYLAKPLNLNTLIEQLQTIS